MPSVVLPLLLLLLAGCATAYSGAVNAYREGRYAEAASRFEELLSRDPDHLDALVGLAVSRYRLGAYDDAIRTLERAVAREPKHPAPRLYLALAHLQKNDIRAAEAQLLAFRELNPPPRLAAQIDRALTLLRATPPSEETRRFIAASLEDAAAAEQELAQTRAELRHAEMYRYWYWDRPYIIVVPRHR